MMEIFKKPRFWTILIAIVIIIAISTGLITNPISNTAKNKAEEFLKVYYTIENTDIVDLAYDPLTNPILRDEPIIDENEDGIIEIIGMDEAVFAKYGDFMTEDALNYSAANRIILFGEMRAREYGSKLLPEYVNLWDEKTSDYGQITYEYSVPALVKFNDGSEELVNLGGSLVMKKDEGSWKVDGFKPDIKELASVLQFGKSYLTITNHSDASIRFIEINTKGNSQGASNADNTDIEKNARFDLEMTDAENLDYTVKLLNQSREVLYERSLTGDFSKGKDVYLYIQEDDRTKELMINRGNANYKDGDNDLPQGAIMVNGVIYLNTGYEVPVGIDEGDIIGKITSTVKFYETLTENGQADFEAKGAKYAQCEDDIVVLINNKWILFKNQEEMLTSFSGNDFGFLMADLSDEEIYNMLRTIWKYIQVDEDYEKNIDSIIERAFIECGIEDASIIENAKSNLKFTVK